MPELMTFQRSDLDQSLSPEQLALLRTVADAAAARQMPLYLVGGFVRDLLLGQTATDFDLVVEGDAIALARALAEQFGGRVTAHARFGTAQWFQPDSVHHAVDFISTRSETYKHAAALPTVKPGGLTDDLARRDFTINTLALRLDGSHWGELRDDLGGLEDLKRGLVRILHSRSFLDDPTRLFRAVRYEQRYGFQVAPETLVLISPARQGIGALSAERIRHELDLILEEDKAAAMLGRLAALGLLQPVHAALTCSATTQARVRDGSRLVLERPIKSIPSHLGRSFLGWHFWLMDLPSTDLESIEQRLHFRANLFTSLLGASTLFAELPNLIEMKPSQWVARLEDVPLTAVYAVFLANPGTLGHQELFNYLETWRHVKPKTNGHDLIKRGLPTGPRYQQVLLRLREAWLDGEVSSESEEKDLLDLLTKLV